MYPLDLTPSITPESIASNSAMFFGGIDQFGNGLNSIFDIDDDTRLDAQTLHRALITMMTRNTRPFPNRTGYVLIGGRSAIADILAAFGRYYPPIVTGEYNSVGGVDLICSDERGTHQINFIPYEDLSRHPKEQHISVSLLIGADYVIRIYTRYDKAQMYNSIPFVSTTNLSEVE